MAGAQIPSAIASGLDLFAAAWAEEWIRFGGSITSSADGGCNVAYGARASGPGYEDAARGLGERVEQRRRDWCDAHYSGRMRGMLAMLEAIPHAREALHAHMLSHAMRQYYSGQPGAGQ
jgi:hypothetical protein